MGGNWVSGLENRGNGISDADTAAGGERTPRIPSPESRATTDPQDELFDVLDADGRPTGVVKTRGAVHRDGDWHGALHIWVGGVAEDGEPFVVFQRRSMTKDTWPGYLDTTIGGHIRSGETLDQTVREAEEEIGLDVALADLTYLGRQFVTGSDGTVSEREIHSVYAARCDQPLWDYRLHPQEVASLVSIPIAVATRLFTGEIDAAQAHESSREGESHVVSLTREDFVMGETSYGLVVLPALLTTLDGGTPEPFEIRTNA